MEDISNWGSSHEQLLTEIANLRNELASSELVIKQLREAQYDFTHNSDEWEFIRSIYEILNASSPSTEALDAYVKKAVEEEREAIAKFVEDSEVEETHYCMTTYEEGKRFQYDMVNAIRARGETK